MSATRLVIFDCDGVLVDSEPISCGVLAQMLTRAGLPTTLEQARREYQGLTLADVRERAERRLGGALAADWLERYQRQRAAAFRRELAPVHGAAEAVQRVRAAGIAVCVASQGALAKTRMTLGLTGLARLFPEELRFSADQVERGKPAPDLFLHAAAAMGAEPTSTVVVEDSPSGVRAAVAAGMRCFGLTIDADEQALVSAGAEALPALAQLPGRLGLAPPPA